MAHTTLLSCDDDVNGYSYNSNKMRKDEKFKVLYSETLGRYAVAASDLKEDEKIHEEMPFAVGPKSDSRVVCLGNFLTSSP